MQALLNDRRVLLPVLLTAVAIAVGSVLIVVLSGYAASSGATAARSTAPATVAGGTVAIDIVEFRLSVGIRG